MATLIADITSADRCVASAGEALSDSVSVARDMGRPPARVATDSALDRYLGTFQIDDVTWSLDGYGRSGASTGVRIGPDPVTGTRAAS